MRCALELADVTGFKIAPYEPGAARVTNRTTGALLGSVVQTNAGNWTPRCLVDGCPWGLQRKVIVQYRLEAAQALWTHHVELHPAPAPSPSSSSVLGVPLQDSPKDGK